MPLLRELLSEVERDREGARSLLKKLVEAYPELSIAAQLKRFLDELSILGESFNKIIEEQASLRMEQFRLREDFNKTMDIIEGLREEQVRLREEQVRLREDFNRMNMELKALREDFSRIVGVVEGLQRGHRRLESAMLAGFEELRKFAGLSFEEFVRRFLSRSLWLEGVLPEGVMLEKRVLDGEDINLFLEDPLIVGEVTAYAESVEEVDKLLRKARIARERFGREPMMILVVLSAPEKAADRINMLSEQYGIKCIVGKRVRSS